MSLNYGLTEDFTLIQITFQILNGIDLQLKKVKVNFVAWRKRSEIRLEIKMKTELADSK